MFIGFRKKKKEEISISCYMHANSMLFNIQALQIFSYFVALSFIWRSVEGEEGGKPEWGGIILSEGCQTS